MGKNLLFTTCRAVLFLCMCQSSVANAQNLISNGDFESYNACPSGLSGIDYSPTFTSFPTVKNWVLPNLTGSSDYFNVCATNATVGVPSNTFGYQQAHSGNAYTGMYGGYGSSSTSLYQEFISTKLAAPLKKDSSYCLSFWVSTTTVPVIPTGRKVAVNSIGAFISDTLPTTTPKPSMDPARFVMSDTNTHLTDTSKWYEIKGIYKAKGGEVWITFGAFYDGNLPAFTDLGSSPTGAIISYFYLDDVAMYATSEALPARSVTYCGDPVQITAGASVGPYSWSTGETTRSITVNAPGVYACESPSTCGVIHDTVNVLPTPYSDTVAEREVTVCSVTALKLKLESPVLGARYKWSTGATTKEITVNTAGTYECEVLRDCRIYPVRITVVNSLPDLPVLHDTSICQNVEAPILQTGYDDLVWYTATGAGPFATQPVIKTAQPGQITLSAGRQRGSCITARVPITITIRPLPRELALQEIVRCSDRPSDKKIGERIGTGDAYEWSTGATSYLIPLPPDDGLYTRIVRNFCGTVTDSFNISSGPCNDCIAFPNAFTPNGDGRNDGFYGMLRCPADEFLLRVYNRWGQMIFVGSKPDMRWDGTHEGRPAEMGTYMYQCSFRNIISGEIIRTQGDILLIR